MCAAYEFSRLVRLAHGKTLLRHCRAVAGEDKHCTFANNIPIFLTQLCLLCRVQSETTLLPTPNQINVVPRLGFLAGTL
jgi:hypothetical protein